jgi:hypothetical protein
MPEAPATAFIAASSALGWHGPFNDAAAVTKFWNDNKAKHPDWKKPENLLDQVTPDIPSISNPLSGIQENLSSWMLRLTEIVLGMVLIAVGISHLSEGSLGKSLGRVVKAAKK